MTTKYIVPVSSSIHTGADPRPVPQQREPRLGQDRLVEQEQRVARGRGGEDAAQVKDGAPRIRHPSLAQQPLQVMHDSCVAL